MKKFQYPTYFLCFFVRKYIFLLVTLFCVSCIGSINNAVFPYFLKIIIDRIQNFKGTFSDLLLVLNIPLISIITLWVFTEVAARMQGYIALSVLPIFKTDIKKFSYDYVKKHSHQYFITHFSGNVSHKISDITTNCESIVNIFCFSFVPIVITGISTFFLMWTVNSIFSLVIVAWCVVQFLISIYFSKIFNASATKHSEALGNVNGKIVDSLSNISIVHLFSRNSYESSYVNQFQKITISTEKNLFWQIEKLKMIQGFSGVLLIIVTLFSLLKFWSEGKITIGDFSLIIMLTYTMIGLLWNINFQLSTFFKEYGSLSNALKIIFTDHEIKDNVNAKPLNVPTGKIEFQNVSFSYSNSQKLFNNLNVSIKSGEKIGLVGFTGSGKTSFINLLLRRHEARAGRVLIDNQDIALVTQNSLREQITVIPQEPILFHRTIMENIRYGRLDASVQEVIEASKLAHCHEFIEKLEHSYDTVVGEHGAKLSNGQRQRISIARAILKDAPILIMDEATSALDSITEKIIQKNLTQLMKKKTCIVIAHRLSTLEHMNRILVFSNGEIIENDSKDELLKSNGLFTRMWDLQVNGSLPPAYQDSFNGSIA